MQGRAGAEWGMHRRLGRADTGGRGLEEGKEDVGERAGLSSWLRRIFIGVVGSL